MPATEREKAWWVQTAKRLAADGELLVKAVEEEDWMFVLHVLADLRVGSNFVVAASNSMPFIQEVAPRPEEVPLMVNKNEDRLHREMKARGAEIWGEVS